MAGPSNGKSETRKAIDACGDLLLWAFIFSAAVNFLYLAPSLFMLQVYDRVLQTGGLVTLGFISVVLVFALATLALLDSMRHRLMGRISLRLDRILSPVLLRAVLRTDSHANDPERRQVLRTFDSFRAAFTGAPANALMDAPWAVFYICVAFMLHWLLGTVTTIGGLILCCVALANERALRTALAQASDLAPRVYAANESDGANAETARALGMRRAIVDRQLRNRAGLNAAQSSALFGTSTYTSITKFLRLVLQSAALGTGAFLAIERQISPGALIAGSILATRALGPMEQIVSAWRQIGEARKGYDTVKRIADQESEAPERTQFPAPTGAIRLEGIGMKAPGQGSRTILADVSLSVSPGEVVGIIGPSGAGKSTLARIAAGAITPDSGEVRLDGFNIADWEPDELGKHIGYLPQDIGLLAGSIAENISRLTPRTEGDSAKIDADIIAAARLAGAHEMIQRLPNSYDARLGAGGRGLSIGQAQRVAFARALFRSPALLVLDEPNAHQDQEGEAALIEAVRQSKARGAAVILVVHRSRVLQLADRLIVMGDGRIVDQGPRDEVAARITPPRQQNPGNVAPLRPRETQT